MVHPIQKAIYDDQAEGWALAKAVARSPRELAQAKAAWEWWQEEWLRVNVPVILALPPGPAPDLPRCIHGSIACPDCHDVADAEEPEPATPLDKSR